MIFGLQRVGKKLHLFATCMVAIGTLISASWILMANSWMQTPAGFTVGKDGAFVPTDWWAICFNPSFPYRWVHMVLAAYLATAFAVGGVGAYHLLRDRRNAVARVLFSMSMWMAAVVMPIQMYAGDEQGRNTLQYQPVKIAAMEGDFTTKAGQPLVLFGLPDTSQNRNRFEIAVPHVGSMILTHSWNGLIRGLDAFPKNDWPVVSIVFWSFRLMVGVAMLMFALGLVSLWLRYKRQLYDTPLFHRAAIALSPAGFFCILAGWTTTEVGRQPWTVYGQLRTAQSVSPVTLPMVAFSCALILVIYTVIFGIGIRYLLAMMAYPPSLDELPPANDPPQRTQGITPGPAGGHGRRKETRPGDPIGVPAE